jgi:hypothetical protein
LQANHRERAGRQLKEFAAENQAFLSMLAARGSPNVVYCGESKQLTVSPHVQTKLFGYGAKSGKYWCACCGMFMCVSSLKDLDKHLGLADFQVKYQARAALALDRRLQELAAAKATVKELSERPAFSGKTEQLDHARKAVVGLVKKAKKATGDRSRECGVEHKAALKNWLDFDQVELTEKTMAGGLIPSAREQHLALAAVFALSNSQISMQSTSRSCLLAAKLETTMDPAWQEMAVAVADPAFRSLAGRLPGGAEKRALSRAVEAVERALRNRAAWQRSVLTMRRQSISTACRVIANDTQHRVIASARLGALGLFLSLDEFTDKTLETSMSVCLSFHDFVIGKFVHETIAMVRVTGSTTGAALFEGASLLSAFALTCSAPGLLKFLLGVKLCNRAAAGLTTTVRILNTDGASNVLRERGHMKSLGALFSKNCPSMKTFWGLAHRQALVQTDSIKAITPLARGKSERRYKERPPTPLGAMLVSFLSKAGAYMNDKRASGRSALLQQEIAAFHELDVDELDFAAAAFAVDGPRHFLNLARYFSVRWTGFYRCCRALCHLAVPFDAVLAKTQKQGTAKAKKKARELQQMNRELSGLIYRRG